MHLTIIGCGTAVPDADRVCSAYYVQTGSLALLLDCGPGVTHRMAALGIDWQNLTHLCITHFHNDHIGDIGALFFAWKWGMLPARTAPLTLIGPRGMKRKLSQLAAAFGDHLSETKFDLKIDEIEPGEQRLLGDVVHFSAVKTPHTPESLAFRIDAPDGSFGYTGDTGDSAEVGDFMRGVHTLVMECSLPDSMPNAVHLTPTTAARMANLAQPHCLVLTHTYPQLERATLPDIMRNIGWSRETIIARDGLTLEVGVG
jgi:ribonuclease BN (tRNA processing enzyme)